MFDKDAKQKKQLMKYYTNDYNNKYERIRKEKQIKKELFEQRRITKKEEHDRSEKSEESYEMKYENMKQTYNKVNRMVTTAQYISMIIKNKTWFDVHMNNQTIKLEDGKTIIKNDFDIIYEEVPNPEKITSKEELIYNIYEQYKKAHKNIHK